MGQEDPLEKEGWQATVRRVTRVRQDLATKHAHTERLSCFWPLELCIFESNSMQRLVLMGLRLICVTLRTHESKVPGFYVSIILMPSFYDYEALSSSGGSATLRP